MKRTFLFGILLVCVFAATAVAQEPNPAPQRSRQTVVLDINMIEVNADRTEDLERIVKDRAGLDRLIAEGKAQSIAGVQMRARSGEPSSARIGQRVPIQTATLPTFNVPADRQRRRAEQRATDSNDPGQVTFVGVGAGIPQIQYENTGLSVDATPYVITNDQIEVRLRLDMTGLGKETGSLTPTFIQRTVNNTVRVQQGETTVLLGIVQNESLWPSPPRPGVKPPDKSRGSFVVLLTARIMD